MKAIVLSAGQGSRLLPTTAHTPKCAVAVGERRLIEHQLERLLEQGIDSITVVVGYGADQVEQLLAERYDPRRVGTLFNPFFGVADNLASCWMARQEMGGEFILLNGDTLFEPAVLERLLGAPPHPVILATDHKSAYDDDDMKVSTRGGRLVRVGKRLPPDQVHGESIGMMLFREQGAIAFRATLERAMREPQALEQWYLSVIDRMADSGQVWTQSMRGLDWLEIDDAADLEQARARARNWRARREELRDPQTSARFAPAVSSCGAPF